VAGLTNAWNLLLPLLLQLNSPVTELQLFPSTLVSLAVHWKTELFWMLCSTRHSGMEFSMSFFIRLQMVMQLVDVALDLWTQLLPWHAVVPSTPQ